MPVPAKYLGSKKASMKKNYFANFYDGGIFHVYNRTNNKELLFKTDENRLYFLRLYTKYLQPYLDTFCWC
jgi:putative transposase